MNEMCKWLSYKKNRTKYVRVTCFAIGVAILLGLFGDGLYSETDWISDDNPVNELCEYLSHTFSEMQAEPRQIRSDNFEICEAADRNDSDREESLRILMIPVIKALAASSGVDLSILAWTLAMGTDIGGSATPIGASANVVGISIASKNGHMIGWGRYCKFLAPATVMVILICMIGIYLRYF